MSKLNLVRRRRRNVRDRIFRPAEDPKREQVIHVHRVSCAIVELFVHN